MEGDTGAVLEWLPGPDIERLRKRVIKLSSQHKLKITTEVNTKITNFLNFKLNLEDGSFRLHRKDNTLPLYVDKQSNHPGHIKKEIPRMIRK